ncbi:MAG: TIGR03086 family metal-binding protein [Actinomycetota bacterium]|jgi:uncharacterized protein (TIGR03086 family)|nr:TIGR03086 family metal-binding protein [Actinomycetota bacterium]
MDAGTKTTSSALLEAHRRAQDAFGRVLARVTDDQLDAPTPCTEWTVRDLVGHVIAGNQRLATGAASHSPGSEHAAELVELHARTAADAHEAFAAPGGLDRSFELPFGSVPGTTVIGMRATDALVHAWDLARATGQSTRDIDEELAAELLEASRARVRPELRGPGKPFGDEQPCDAGASASDRLAAFLGRPQG